jgi:hypothetical protein
MQATDSSCSLWFGNDAVAQSCNDQWGLLLFTAKKGNVVMKKLHSEEGVPEST